MAFNPRPIRRPREQVEAQIREAIMSGTFRRGDKLPSETALAEQFSVSRTTVREALRALAEAGLVSKIPGVAGGSFVQSVDHRSLGGVLGDSLANVLRIGSISPAELRQLRRLLEVPSAALAAEQRTEDHLAVLDRVVAREKEARVEDPEVPDLDISFHSAVAEASGNRPLASFVAALHRVVRPVESLNLSPEAGRETVRQHLRVVHAIRSRRPEDAAQAMSEHLDYIEALPEGRPGPGARTDPPDERSLDETAPIP